jgi:hypothetical integral membrane protein (TIGR02206 family)
MKNILRYFLIIGLIFSEPIIQHWYIVTGQWDKRYSLPFQLCDFSVIASVVMLYFRSYSMFEILYFAGIGGALAAILSPELWLGFPHFRYFHFFVIHAFIIIAQFYMVFIEGFRPTKKSLLKFFIFINVFGVIIFIINIFLDSNYMFISKPTLNNTFLNSLGVYPWYLISMEGIMMIVSILILLPFEIYSGSKKNKSALD